MNAITHMGVATRLDSFGFFAVYHPHGTVAAGVVAVAAGVYELTPLKRHFRLRCREGVRSGLGSGSTASARASD
jgi:predicted metal-binding membrane protein